MVNDDPLPGSPNALCLGRCVLNDGLAFVWHEPLGRPFFLKGGTIEISGGEKAEMDIDGFVLAFEQLFNNGEQLNPEHLDELREAQRQRQARKEGAVSKMGAVKTLRVEMEQLSTQLFWNAHSEHASRISQAPDVEAILGETGSQRMFFE